MPQLKSPITGKPLSPIALAEGLEAYHCADSGGHYIPAVSYMKWLEAQPARLPHVDGATTNIDTEPEPPAARLCPESGTLMTRYKVGHGFPFSIDRSITGGIWLDGGEWDALRQRNFHDEIHLVFTAPWQKQVRNERAEATYADRLQTALGPEILERLDFLCRELENHPQRNLAVAYLSKILG